MSLDLGTVPPRIKLFLTTTPSTPSGTKHYPAALPRSWTVTRWSDIGLVPARRCWVKYLSLIHFVLSLIKASYLEVSVAYSCNDI